MEHITRRQQRIWTLQALFEIDFREISTAEATANLEEREPQAIEATYTRRLIPLVHEHLQEIDTTIGSFAKDWRLERMSKVDLSILRMAVAEMKYVDDLVDSVVINEAIELAKEFSTEKSGKFINGILGSLSQELSATQEEER